MEFSSFIKALAWTFVHSLWLGLVAALIAAIVISSTRKSTARLRYNLLSGVMGAFLLCALVVFISEILGMKTVTASPEAANVLSNGFIRTAVEFEPLVFQPDTSFTRFEVLINQNFNSLMIAWFIFFLWKVLQLFSGIMAVERLRTHRTHSVDIEWTSKFEDLKNRLGIRQTVGLFQSEIVKVPVAIGFLKPIVLLPIGMVANLPACQVEAILLHELGHIRRKDFIINLMQHFVDSIFFFNPAVSWISSLLRQEREACCDDIAVNNISQRRNYLEALVSFQEYSFRQPSYVMAFGSKKNYLLNRVKRIACNENKRLSITEKISLVLGLFMFSAFTLIDRPSLLSEKSQGKPAEKREMVEISLEEFRDRSVQMDVPVIQRHVGISFTHDRQAPDTVPSKEAKMKTEKAGKKEISKEMLKEKEREIHSDIIADKKEKEADTKEGRIKSKLEEIRLIKESMQVQKDAIGEKKKAISESDPKKAEVLLKELQKQRAELQTVRDQLEQKRVELEKERKGQTNSKQPELSKKPVFHVKPLVLGKGDKPQLFDPEARVSMLKEKIIDVNIEKKKLLEKMGKPRRVPNPDLKEKLVMEGRIPEKPNAPPNPMIKKPSSSRTK